MTNDILVRHFYNENLDHYTFKLLLSLWILCPQQKNEPQSSSAVVI